MEQLSQILQNPWVVLGLVIWTIPWKGWALWRSARAGEKLWFVVLLVINTLAILEILYLFVFSQKSVAKKSAIPKSSSLPM